MKIEILKLIDGAKKAKGLTVVIDVFRAMTVECFAINNNATNLIATSEVSVAKQLFKSTPNSVTIGERKGVKIEGFNYGNSPTEIENVDFSGKTVIHTTSAGTQGIANAKNATEIITASFVNATAVANYIKKVNPKFVSIVAMGLNGTEETDEDNFCAEYIKSLLENKKYDLSKICETLKQTSGAKFFDKTQNSVFPENDFHLCTQFNKFNFVIKAEKHDNYFVMKKTELS